MREEAYQHLERAEDNLAKGLEAIQVTGEGDDWSQAWKEYTVALMRAAAALEDHQRVYDLYRRWRRHHVHWENHFMGAVACWNLGQYRKAASLWAEVAREWRAGYLYQQVCILVDQGVIPPFPLDYSKKDARDFEALGRNLQGDESWVSRTLEDSNLRIFLLGTVFTADPSGPDFENAQQMLNAIVHQGGSWGEELGQRLLQSNCATPLKMAAAGADGKGRIEPKPARSHAD